MKNTIYRMIVGGSSVFALSAGLMAGEKEQKIEKTDTVTKSKKVALSKELGAKVLDALKEAGVDKTFLEEAGQDDKNKAIVRRKKVFVGPVTRKTVVIGSDGDAKALDFNDLKDVEIKELLDKGGVSEVVSSKMVVIDENGNQTVTPLENTEDLGQIIEEALEEANFEESDFETKLLGVGPAFLQRGEKKLMNEITELREEVNSQRELLEKILSKL